MKITHHKKIDYKTPPITLVLKYICKFPYSVMHLFNKNIFHMFKFVNVGWIFFLNKIVEVKANEMNKRNLRCDVHMYQQKPNAIFLCL